MKIEHLAIWVKELERMKQFYERYFHAQAGKQYHNPRKHFTSYFLSFEDGPRLELMHKPEIPTSQVDLYQELIGMAHFAVSVGSEQKVHELTETFRTDGFEVVGEPRWTGDGYYESVILDPEGNRIEITV